MKRHRPFSVRYPVLSRLALLLFPGLSKIGLLSCQALLSSDLLVVEEQKLCGLRSLADMSWYRYSPTTALKSLASAGLSSFCATTARRSRTRRTYEAASKIQVSNVLVYAGHRSIPNERQCKAAHTAATTARILGRSNIAATTSTYQCRKICIFLLTAHFM